ncbi:hypothetical protein Slin15195_G050650 [Septoria linicola]|uniref:Uncharacterized protein n=1 Tax=Septoria linicola TaxID=215465 RepID=A0A9Q9AW38_9PEZI|nr:hypothetical protein Slin15195_G050650 [Septoria linicola]
MGGAAFAHAAADGQPTLRTPRMSPDTYAKLKGIYTQRLIDYFPGCAVTQLQEAPEKLDYGDIDFMIGSDKPFDAMHLATSLGAAGIISYGGLCMIAVPVSGEKYSSAPIRYTNLNSQKGRKPSDQLSSEVYAQIDIDLVKPDLFAWHAFYASYGDLSGLLGQIMHNLGFTVSDKGIILRLKELDDAKASEIHLRVTDKQGQLHLSNDPNQVMRFLGLDATRYRGGFGTLRDFYAWLAECRLLTADYVGNLQYKRKDTSNQRQKEHKRPMISNFFISYLPVNMDETIDENNNPAALGECLLHRRQQWREEAIEFFSKHEELNKLRDDLSTSIANQTADFLIKPMVLAHYGGSKDKVHEIIRAIRRWVGFENGQPKILSISHSDDESQLRFWLSGSTLRDPKAVDDWIRDNWGRCRALEREKSKT